MLIPSQIGAVAEREVSHALLRAGWSIFTPLFDPRGRIDLVAIAPDAAALRLQVKTARLLRGDTVLCFRTCSNTGTGRSTTATRSMRSGSGARPLPG